MPPLLPRQPPFSSSSSRQRGSQLGREQQGRGNPASPPPSPRVPLATPAPSRPVARRRRGPRGWHGAAVPPQKEPVESAPSHRGSVSLLKRRGLSDRGTSQLDRDAHQKNTREQRFALCSGLGFTSGYTGSIIQPGRREPGSSCSDGGAVPAAPRGAGGDAGPQSPRRSSWLEPKNHPLPGAELWRPAPSPPPPPRPRCLAGACSAPRLPLQSLPAAGCRGQLGGGRGCCEPRAGATQGSRRRWIEMRKLPTRYTVPGSEAPTCSLLAANFTEVRSWNQGAHSEVKRRGTGSTRPRGLETLLDCGFRKTGRERPEGI